MKKLLLIILIVCPALTQAQEKKNPNPDPMHAWYGMSATEMIFSFGDVNSGGQIPDNVMRFTLFLNLQSQRHYNFSNHFGIYSGFGIRNVGFINKFPVPGQDDAKVKQRSYSFGIPLALKFGGMETGTYLALGGEAEFMFNYKEKIFEGGRSSKQSKWFSSEVNTFNPSLFADIRFHNGTFFRFRYYLDDFLKNKDMSFYLPGSGTKVFYQPQKSTLFYVAIETAFKIKRKHHLTLKDS